MRLDCGPRRITTKKKIAERMAPQIVKPSLREVIRSIVEHVATLTHALQISPPISSRVMVQMCRRQDDSSGSEADSFNQVRPPARSSLSRPPGLHLRIEPAAIGQASHDEAVRPATDLAAALCPLKSHDTAHLGPVCRVKITEVMAYRQERRLSDRFRTGQHLVLTHEALHSRQTISGIRNVKRVSYEVELTVSVFR